MEFPESSKDASSLAKARLIAATGEFFFLWDIKKTPLFVVSLFCYSTKSL